MSSIFCIRTITLTFVFSGLFISIGLVAQDETRDDKAGQLEVQDAEFSETEIQFFESKVRPIFEANCMECHGDDSSRLGGGLALISRRSILEGGDSGSAVELGDPADSLLLDAINYGEYEMPPKGKLKDEEIKIIAKWVQHGMPWPRDSAENVLEGKGHGVPTVNEDTKAFWSFQPVKEVRPPQVQDDTWCVNDIDRFVLARLENAELQPATQATRADLIRRAYYDLTGLPPTIEQVQAFVENHAPEAYANLIDELLSSQHYGEKWGRHWLDVVRYAESNSFERDGTKPFVWRYRDYVIRSFNDDKPYDQFLTEQLAGDEFENPSRDEMIATGYYRLGQWDDEPADPNQALYDDLDDILATTTQGMMGLTVNCARCHDHKIDPIPQKDYYQMLSFFRNVRRYGVRSPDSVERASITTVEKSVPPTKQEVESYGKQLADAERRKNEIVELVKGDFESVEHDEFQYERNHERLVRQRIEKGIITKKQFEQFWHGHHDLMRFEEKPSCGGTGSLRQ